MNHIAAPPPPPPVTKQPSAAGKAYPKSVVIQVQGHSTGSSAKLQPASKGASINVKKKAAGSSRDGIRQHIRAKKKELAHASSASPLDDPVILVQNLPDLSETTASESLPSLHEEQQPSTATQVSEATAAEPCDAAAAAGVEDCGVGEAARIDATESPPVHPWPAPPTAENLEFERMVLQLRSVVELANDNDEDEASESDADEDEGDDETREEEGGDAKEKNKLLTDGDSPPPPYSSSASDSGSPLALDMAVFEQDTFKQALHSFVTRPGDAARTAEALAGLPPAHHRSLLWMRDYVARVTTNPNA